MSTEESPNIRSANARTLSYSVRSPASSLATAMPMPPPPAAALTITGYPIAVAASTAASAVAAGSCVPRATGTPASAIRLRALILSPIALIASAPGPTHTRPLPTTVRAKSAFSLRKP